jgi:hypothetical protein
MVSSNIPVVHVTINGGQTINFLDSNQVLNTNGFDSAGCPDTGSVSVRRDESQQWERIG